DQARGSRGRGNGSPAAIRPRMKMHRTFTVLVVAFPRQLVSYHCQSMAANDRNKKRDEMPRILMTGAAGGIGTSLRKLLPPIYPDLLLSDINKPADLAGGEKFKAAELSDPARVEAICEGVDGILHFGGFSVEGPWDNILQSNIIGCYNLFEAARKKGVKRIVFASSNHAVGFYPRHHRIGTDVQPRPDSRYGVSKVFGEA